jgi:hypothetical protein
MLLVLIFTAFVFLHFVIPFSVVDERILTALCFCKDLL